MVGTDQPHTASVGMHQGNVRVVTNEVDGYQIREMEYINNN